MESCPICELRHALEQKWVEYITGPAMMEPDVRQKTNELGFCRRHYDEMLKCRNRLSMALMLQTHLGEKIEKQRHEKPQGIFAKKPDNLEENCFICSCFERELERILENIIVIWAREEEFQKLYIQQKYVCSLDLDRIIRAAPKKLKGKKLDEFKAVSVELWKKQAITLKADIDAFCRLYDYRSNQESAPTEDVAAAIERAVSFLSAE